MLYVRRSLLEEYRRAVATDYGNEQRLIDTIREGWDEPKWQMLAGTAWHTCLEKPLDYTTAGEGLHIGYGGYTFSTLDVQAGKELIGPGAWEVLGRRVWRIDGQDVEVEGTADHLRGACVQDNKTCFSGVDPEDYEGALQWRFYLLIHGASVFRYNCFDFRNPKEGYCELKDVVSFRFWPYPGLESDCRAWLARFLDWCRQLNLTKYLNHRRVNQ